MIKELCKDEAILSKRCERATAQDAPVAQDLVDTMHSLEDCGCLAANQIGVGLRLFVYDCPEERGKATYHRGVVINPVPPHTTVAGVPAKIVGRPECDKPSLDMDQCL